MAGNRAEKLRRERNGDATLGARLMSAREARELSPAQLARRLGVKSETLRGWETNRRTPRANKLTMLAGVLGVTPSWLLAGNGRKPAPPPGEIESIRDEMLRLGDDLAETQARPAVLAERLQHYRQGAD